MTPREAVAQAFARIAEDGRPGVWITVADEDDALAAAATIERRLGGGELLPLAGSTLAVKDNIDVAGLPTTAGCPAYAYVPERSAPAVDALIAAGAVVIGKTNLDQFATGLVGTRSPYGVCPNAFCPELIAGGSSAGSAVAVATGMVDLALGTDTAGSGRVPAACNGIVGLKPTRGRISTQGVVPACASLDCVSVFATSVPAAAAAVEIASASPAHPDDAWRRMLPSVPVPDRPLRIGVPRGALEFDGDPSGPSSFEAAMSGVGEVGTELVAIDLDPFLAAGRLLYEGAFVAERYEAVGAFIDAHPGEVDPIVGSIIAAAASLPAWKVFRDRTELERLRQHTLATWAAADAIVVPSVPRVPTVAEVLAAPIERNAMLGTYTNFVNLLDLCALTVPVAGTSVTLIAPAGGDELLVSVAARLPPGRPAIPRSA